MHEQSLIKDIIHRIGTIAEEKNAKRVKSVKIRLGALSHCTPEHFKEHYDEVAVGTIAEGAELDIEVLTDMKDPLAQEIVLESIDIEE